MEAFGLVVRYSGMATSTAIVSRYKYCIVEDCHAVSTLLLDPAYCGMVLKALRHFFRKVNVLPVSYTHLRAHETRHDLVCRLLLEKKN